VPDPAIRLQQRRAFETMGPSLSLHLEAPVNRSRVGIALSGAAILLACGGVAAAAAGAPPSAGLVSADPTVSVTATATPDPSDTDDDGVEPADDDGSADDQGDQNDRDATDAGDDSGATGTGGVGPDAAGPAHHGLCTAWSHVQGTPGKAADSTAFRNLQAVGCDDVPATTEPGDDDATDEGDSGETRPPGTGQGKTKTEHSSSTASTKTSKSSKTSKGAKGSTSGKGAKRTHGSHGRH
jgi:hypothetical protein